tara:strand:- start:423 stop:1013 length:591 start_codon:yes stop_codon:yes gene_type:complete
MNIKKSEFERIIKEEIKKMLIDESWKDAAGEGLGNIFRSFAKGFAGKDSSDNPFSRGTYSALGATMVPRIDKIFKKLIDEINEFKSHDEGKKIVDPQKGPEGNQTPEQVMKAFQQSLMSVSQDWIKMTVMLRSGAPEQGEEEGGEEEAPDVDSQGLSPEERERYADLLPEEENIAEVIRQEVRDALQERVRTKRRR